MQGASDTTWADIQKAARDAAESPHYKQNVWCSCVSAFFDPSATCGAVHHGDPCGSCKLNPVLKDVPGPILRLLRSGAAEQVASLISRADWDGRRIVLQYADLAGLHLTGIRLWGADLRGTDLRGAVLRGADLSDTDLRDADLRGAELQGAVLWGAVLTGADLEGAVREGV